MDDKTIKEIKITYTDGSEKLIDRGAVFSVHKHGEDVCVRFEGAVNDSEFDTIAVLGIASRTAREIGITEEFEQKAKEVLDGQPNI